MACLDVVCNGSTNNRAENLIGVTKHAVAAGALALPDFLALGNAARPGWQALEVGAHVNVPRLNFLGSGVAANAWIFATRLRCRKPAGAKQDSNQ